MKEAFLDTNKPIATCSQSSCENCPVKPSLHCHFGASDLGKFLAFTLPIFIIGGVSLYAINFLYLATWMFLFLFFFGLIEIRVVCSHCPHYAETGKSLKCWANYGSPKLWKYRPGPMNRIEKAIFFGYGALVVVYPLVAMLMHSMWIASAIFSLSTALAARYMSRRMCPHCMNFACPFNDVDESLRNLFFTTNPEVAAAWKIKSD